MIRTCIVKNNEREVLIYIKLLTMRASILAASSNLRTLVSIQVLCGSIFLFCMAYLVLSTFHPLSLHNIISGLRFQLWQTNGNGTTNVTDFVTAITQNPIIKTTIPSNESFICDHIKLNNEHNKTNSSPFEKHRLNALRRKYSTFCFISYIILSTYFSAYCDIVPIPRRNWVPARRYTESDIVFLIYTGASFYHSRATAVRDTWLSRVTHKYFFSSIPYPTLPVTVIEGAGEDYSSNMKKLYVGMQLAYREHNQTAKFYYVAGCDTFVNVPHILKRLDSFNYTQPLVVGGYPFGHNCYIKKNVTTYGITYPSGGAGFFLSARMMEMMYPKLTDFFEKDWPISEKPYSDGKEFIFVYSLFIIVFSI
jgi:hypothetical protein